jgi:sterol desaturase/sphingolipid hydroxylase (fatty acid hydroxylase superfamily)
MSAEARTNGSQSTETWITKRRNVTADSVELPKAQHPEPMASAAAIDARYNLGRMTMSDLVRGYLTYPAIIFYAVLGLTSFALAILQASSLSRPAIAVLSAVLLYPMVWYLLHRFVLHGRFLYKSSLTARLWKRIHFDHHQEPRDMKVLFGALYTTVPTMIVIACPIGWAIGGTSGLAAALGSAVACTCYYEFCHCVQHLPHIPKSRFLRRMKRLHLAHHFHNETGNFGITNFGCDRLFGTYYQRTNDTPASQSVFNLGYTGEEAKRYPWVAAFSTRRPDIRLRGRRLPTDSNIMPNKYP